MDRQERQYWHQETTSLRTSLSFSGGFFPEDALSTMGLDSTLLAGAEAFAALPGVSIPGGHLARGGSF